MLLHNHNLLSSWLLPDGPLEEFSIAIFLVQAALLFQVWCHKVRSYIVKQSICLTVMFLMSDSLFISNYRLNRDVENLDVDGFILEV